MRRKRFNITFDPETIASGQENEESRSLIKRVCVLSKSGRVNKSDRGLCLEAPLCVCTLSHGVGVCMCVYGGQVEAKFFLSISLAGNLPSALSVGLPPFDFILIL